MYGFKYFMECRTFFFALLTSDPTKLEGNMHDSVFARRNEHDVQLTSEGSAGTR